MYITKEIIRFLFKRNHAISLKTQEDRQYCKFVHFISFHVSICKVSSLKFMCSKWDLNVFVVSHKITRKMCWSYIFKGRKINSEALSIHTTCCKVYSHCYLCVYQNISKSNIIEQNVSFLYNRRISISICLIEMR